MNASSPTVTVTPEADGTYALRNVGRITNRYATADAAHAAARRIYGENAPDCQAHSAAGTRHATTADLHPGQRVRWQDATNALGHLLPLTPDNPGRVLTVKAVAPDMITAGRKVGQQARSGRGSIAPGALLFRVTFTDGPDLFSTTADYRWTLA